MRFDLSGCGAGLDESANTLLKLGPWAESLGYDGLWLNEEHFGQNSRVCLSPILLAMALAMRTRTIRIGFSVLVLPLYQPIRLAEEVATLDILSEGRVDLGISRGNTSRYLPTMRAAMMPRTCGPEIMDPIESAKSNLFDTSSWGEFCDVTLTSHGEVQVKGVVSG
jgi:alkanesulfonate monooxygenase SsuD/methylene tetrahydromethanopterin reductase-like flavin-dependent oxidoreductase (luciferase family)